MIRDIELRASPETAANPQLLKAIAAEKLGLCIADIHDYLIVRRSIDARQRNIIINLYLRVATDEDLSVPSPYTPINYSKLPDDVKEIVIIGAGPAGLFAALRAIELGIKPVVIERGKDVDTRLRDISRISRENIIDSDSNYCFGEGGAGAYSDGKLYTRSKKRGDVSEILNILHQHGADKSILVDAHPHIGSDKLPRIIKEIRHTIERSGGEIHFRTRATGLLRDSYGSVIGVITNSNEEFYGPVILATGHSARDVYRMLASSGIKLEAKGIAIGVRLEHPQHLIDCIQYHSKQGRGRFLPPAEYSFVTQVDNRGVYSFCMCPGGVIVPAASSSGQSVVNGMSASARCSQWANSGMVVELHPGDFPEFAKYKEFEMMELQEQLEHSLWQTSGSTLKAPAQRMRDFTEGKISTTLPKTSYAPGIYSAPLHFLLPPQISKRLKEGFKKFGTKSPSFLTNEAILVGLESRTSSPIRIPRDSKTMQHIEISGLYPAGEGAGYAGGIVSAAIDGRRCVEAIHALFSN